ncbi:MAG: hypothetical protein JNG85_16515, partial [Spirochaetaceae bacterium]|nr:hypothetical protein [Spirochaetaceae bacterium]
MPAMRIVHLLRGTAIAAGVAALALALALWGFGRVYYLHPLLAAGAVLLFLAG